MEYITGRGTLNRNVGRVMKVVEVIWQPLRAVGSAIHAKYKSVHTTTVYSHNGHAIDIQEPKWSGRVSVRYDGQPRFGRSNKTSTEHATVGIYEFTEIEDNEVVEYTVQLSYGFSNISGFYITRNGYTMLERY